MIWLGPGGRTTGDEEFTRTMQIHLQRLIMYAQASDTQTQLIVAEKLANEAVKRKYCTNKGRTYIQR